MPVTVGWVFLTSRGLGLLVNLRVVVVWKTMIGAGLHDFQGGNQKKISYYKVGPLTPLTVVRKKNSEPPCILRPFLGATLCHSIYNKLGLETASLILWVRTFDRPGDPAGLRYRRWRRVLSPAHQCQQGTGNHEGPTMVRWFLEDHPALVSSW